MADIAKLAGVAVSTVSRALAGSPLVSADTRARIAELAKEHGYSINVGAQNLRLGQNQTIAVVVPYEAATGQNLSDPFFLSLLGCVVNAITARGWEVLLSRVEANAIESVAQPVLTGRAMGLVLMGHLNAFEPLNDLVRRGIPIVVWGALRPGQQFCTVGGDNFRGGELAGRHLVNQGARRILFLGDPALPEFGQRLEGCLAVQRAAGIEPDPELQKPVPLLPAAIDAHLASLIGAGIAFDAVFAASDLAAATAIGTLRRLGLRVPQDVAVVGYDDITIAVHFDPPLTTIRQPIEQAGIAIVDSLLAQIEGRPAESTILPTELIQRRSSLP